MAVKPRQHLQERKTFSQEIINYLKTGVETLEIWSLSEKRHQEVLEYYRSEILPQWIKDHPCSRPWAWWRFDAPRWEDPYSDCYYHGTYAEPRQRLGGTGTPDFEVLGYVPDFRKGIPTGFVTKFEEKYYNGTAKDINGNPIGTKYKQGDFKGQAIDPDDPPIFESEAVYLERHGLLTPLEIKHLQRHPEIREPEKFEVFV